MKLKLVPTMRRACKFIRCLMSDAMLRYMRTIKPYIASAGNMNGAYWGQ